jgi:hypothetical protein
MSDHQAVLDQVNKYLHALYEGNTQQLREVFHPNARVEDIVTGTFRSRSTDEFVEVVGSRQSPSAAGESFTMKPLTIGVLGDMATATAELHFLGNHFYDVLSLLRHDGQWRIMHKLFGTAA